MKDGEKVIDVKRRANRTPEFLGVPEGDLGPVLKGCPSVDGAETGSGLGFLVWEADEEEPEEEEGNG